MKIHRRGKGKKKKDRIQRNKLKLYKVFHQTHSMPTQKTAISHWLHPQQGITTVKHEVYI